jgi:hypothetical protein
MSRSSKPSTMARTLHRWAWRKALSEARSVWVPVNSGR